MMCTRFCFLRKCSFLSADVQSTASFRRDLILKGQYLPRYVRGKGMTPSSATWLKVAGQASPVWMRNVAPVTTPWRWSTKFPLPLPDNQSSTGPTIAPPFAMNQHPASATNFGQHDAP